MSDSEHENQILKKKLQNLTEKYEKILKEHQKIGITETKSKAENVMKNEKEKYENKLEEMREKLAKSESKTLSLTKKNLELEIEMEEIKVFKENETKILKEFEKLKNEILNYKAKETQYEQELSRLRSENEKIIKTTEKERKRFENFMTQQYPESLLTGINGMKLDVIQYKEEEEEEEEKEKENKQQVKVEKKKEVSLEKYTKILPVKNVVESVLNYFENLPKDAFDDNFNSSENPSSIFMINSSLCEVLMKVFKHGLNKSRYWFAEVHFWEFIVESLSTSLILFSLTL
jgi:chromosome segregation ATPase